MTARRWSPFKKKLHSTAFPVASAAGTSSLLCYPICFQGASTSWLRMTPSGRNTVVVSILQSQPGHFLSGNKDDNCYIQILKWEPSLLPPVFRSWMLKLVIRRLWVTEFLLHHTLLEDLVCLKYKQIHNGTSGFREQWLDEEYSGCPTMTYLKPEYFGFPSWNTSVTKCNQWSMLHEKVSNCTISVNSTQNLGIYSLWRYKKITFFSLEQLLHIGNSFSPFALFSIFLS